MDGGLLGKMELELIITKPDLEKEEYPTLRRLNGARFNLQEKVNRYIPKSDGTKVFNALKQYFIVQAAAYEKLRKESVKLMEEPAKEAGEPASLCPSLCSSLCLATYLASLAGSSVLDYQKDSRVSFFSNKKIDYLKPFPDPVVDSLEIYLQSMKDLGSSFALESITEAFFNWGLDSSFSKLEEAGWLEKVTIKKAIIDGETYPLELCEHKHKKEKRDKLSFDLSRYVIKDTPKNDPDGKQRPKISNAAFIHGHDEVKEEFKKIAALIKYKEYFRSLFDPKRLFNNYLLVGPSGTGKTTLVNSLAGECGLYFIRVPCVELGSEFFSKTASNIHGVYASARQVVNSGKHQGVIIFFDEIDHIAKRRGYGNSSEGDSLITTLNENLDGGSSQEGIITFGATNVEHMIDPAILSRFRKLHVGYPSDEQGVIGIHQAVISRMETYSGKRMFSQLDYASILEFSRQDERYKSGRIIEKILYNAAIKKALQSQSRENREPAEKKELLLVTSGDVLSEYAHCPVESDHSTMQMGGAARVA